MIDESLVRASDSVLLVVDAQPGFLTRLDPSVAESLVDRIGWLARVATRLGIPILATEEETGHNGPTDPTIVAALASGSSPYRKEIFGLADQADIMSAVDATGRRTAVLVGLETDVCVAHSALGLVDRGYRVVVVADATGSPGDAHAAGLDRMVRSGVLVISTKGLYYEWIRTVEKAHEIEVAVPPPLDLRL
ncbi:MAG TPA: isochorismatase family protein [Candidatus Limnocylindrales bacterium]|nr:isochorismatase family protein [Candidatus Limnocylindrales bacterium]